MGLYLFANYHGAENILWHSFPPEEESAAAEVVDSVKITEDASKFPANDIASIHFIDDSLTLDCGTFDPWISFPLPKPLKNSSSDVFDIFISINYSTNKGGNLQLFYDFGNGFSGDNSSITYIEEASETTKNRFSIIGWKKGMNLHAIRIDPPDGSKFTIKSIEFMKKTGDR